jgi:hypothetical protein
MPGTCIPNGDVVVVVVVVVVVCCCTFPCDVFKDGCF